MKKLNCRGLLAATAAFTMICSHAKGDLLALWTFDKGLIVDRVLLDSLGGSNGVCRGGSLNTVEGVDGLAWYGGAGTHFSVPDPNGHLNVSDQMTVSAWIRLNRRTKKWPNQGIVSKNRSWSLLRQEKTSFVEFVCHGIQVGNEPASVSSNMLLDDGKWHHVVGTYDGNSISLYVNGKLASQKAATGSIRANRKQILIGKKAGSEGGGFRGIIDEVALFDHGMNEKDVTLLFEQGAKRLVSAAKTYRVNSWLKYLKHSSNHNRKAAQKTLERTLKSYEKLSSQGSNKQLATKMYAALARIFENDSDDAERIAPLNKKIIELQCYGPDYVHALLWLYVHLEASEFRELIGVCYKDNEQKEHVSEVVQALYEKNHWELLDEYLDVVFSKTDKKIEFAAHVVSVLAGRISHAWCQNDPFLREALVENLKRKAAQYTADEQHLRAREAYGRIIEFCRQQGLSTGRYEYEIGWSFFLEGRHAQAITRLKAFINEHGASHKDLAKRAQMSIGVSQVLTNNLPEAYDSFIEATVRYPSDRKMLGWTIFHLGYGSMITGRWKESQHLFNTIIRLSPNSKSARKARLCLQRIAIRGHAAEGKPVSPECQETKEVTKQ